MWRSLSLAAAATAFAAYGAIVYEHSGASPVAIDDTSAVIARGVTSVTPAEGSGITITPTNSTFPSGSGVVQAGPLVKAGPPSWVSTSGTGPGNCVVVSDGVIMDRGAACDGGWTGTVTVTQTPSETTATSPP